MSFSEVFSVIDEYSRGDDISEDHLEEVFNKAFQDLFESEGLDAACSQIPALPLPDIDLTDIDFGDIF